MELAVPTASVTLEAANALATAAMAAARAIGFDAAVAVADAGGTLRAFQRADGANPFPADVAIRKAWTAATSGLPTHVWNGFVADPELAPMAGLPNMIAVAGGLPLHDAGQLIGGIGVSGGNQHQDREAAERALAEIGFPAT